MAANSNYYGYSSTVQQPQVYASQIQSPQVAQTAYGSQTTAAYVSQPTTPSTSPYATQQSTPSRVMPQTQTAYAASAATAYPQAALQGSSYGYTARVQETSTTHPSQSYQTSGHTAAAYSSQTSGSYYEAARDTSTTASYDASKSGSYYGQQHAAPSQQAYGYGSTTPATNKTMYPSQSPYSTPTSSNTSGQLQGTPAQKSHSATSVTANVSYPYSTGKHQNSNYNQNSGSYSNSSSNWSGSGGSNSNYQQSQGYDAAVYNAASSYLQQQQPRPKWNKNNNNNKPPQARQKLLPKQQQFHYCDVCKISCAGPQTYKEHLEGQKHKKKEAAAKQLEAGDGYKCSLCDVVCTGTEAFNAHLKGAKHMKTVKLHTKLGKPIPDIPSAEVQDKEKKKEDPKDQTPKVPRNHQRRTRKPSTPKITFIGGSTLNSSAGATTPEATASETTPTTTPTTPQEKEGEVNDANESKETTFVGEDYIEEVKSDAGKVVGFECKLCDCKFNDQIAREAHLSGRRHKLSYKKKVQPDYVVDKPVRGRQQQHKPLMDDKARRKWEQDIHWKKQETVWRQEEVRRWGEEEYWRRLEEEERMWEEQEHQRHEVDMMEWERRHRMGPPRGDFPHHDMFSPMNIPRPKQDSQDDRLVMMKHKQVYPNEQELTAVQNIVSAVEKALKLVSDNIADEDTPAAVEVKAPAAVEVKEEKMEVVVAEGTTEEKPTEEKPEVKKSEEVGEAKKPLIKPKEKRTLKGVMRVGVLAKGLLLHERLDVDLVVLCQDRPTKQLLHRVNTKLPEQLAKVTDEKYDLSVEESTNALVVSTTKEPPIKVVITLTSPVMRDVPDAKETEKETSEAEEQKDVLDGGKCLEALASLRHAKWFQAKANGVPSCVIIIRVFRDMRDRLPVFLPLSSWAMELLVEKCLSSSDQPLGPGEAFRRVLECIASGVILPGGPGLQDPCEKELADASREMTAQEREDLTTTAQHFLRLQAFRQLHKVLGIDPLPPSRFRGRYGRGGRFKRRREDSGQGDGSAKKEKKDGDQEETTAPETTASETTKETPSVKATEETPTKS